MKGRCASLAWGLLLSLAVFIGTVGLPYAADRRNDPERLVIMTLNAEFLWDGVQPEEGRANFPWKGSQTEAEDHMRKVADLIIRSNPDIVNLVEVENLDALRTFNDKFLAGRGYKPYLVEGKDSFTGQDVALLTRVDPEGEEIHRDDREGQSGTVLKSVSKNYHATLNVNGTKIALVGLHFLAIPPSPDRRLPREAQADAIRSLGIELKREGHELVVLGDFNDYDGEADSLDHIDSTPITKVLSWIKQMDPGDPTDDLVNVTAFAPKAIRYTAFYDANRNDAVDHPQELTSIDHILLSKKLASMVQSVEIPHHHDPREVTDHFPVVAQIRLQQGGGPVSPPHGGVRITRLLPNPEGNENEKEEATLKNFSAEPVSLTGWKLRDLSGRTWALDSLGVLAAGQERTILRNGQPMAMSNGGDSIDLIDAAGKVLQSVTYPKVDEGEVIVPAQ